jgi:hypothetical protein
LRENSADRRDERNLFKDFPDLLYDVQDSKEVGGDRILGTGGLS